MADVKISGLPASTVPLAGTEVLPIVQSGSTKQVSIANVTAGRDVSALSITTPTYKAANSAGGALQNASGVNQLQWGAGGGNNVSVDVAITINPANAAVAISPTGTGTVAISPAGALTINPTAASTINNTSIGATTASTGRFTSVTATTGNVVIGTSGQGIDFSATPGTGTSELLNDYEEGTWTPTVFDAATGGNQGTIGGTAAGEYTKVGNLVTIHCVLININTTGMTAGNVFYIGGLPFAAKNTTSIDFHGVTDSRNITTTSGGVIASWLQDNASRARLFTTTSAGGVTGVLVSNVTSTTAVIFLSLTYLAA